MEKVMNYGWVQSVVKCLWHNVGEYSEVCCKLECNDVLTKPEIWRTQQETYFITVVVSFKKTWESKVTICDCTGEVTRRKL